MSAILEKGGGALGASICCCAKSHFLPLMRRLPRCRQSYREAL